MWLQRISAVVIVAVCLVGAVSALASATTGELRPSEVSLAGSSSAAVRYQPPVPGPVLRGFEPPAADFGEGHRGVDLAAEPGDPVHAAADGVVHHAGRVGVVTWVSIRHADGILTSYGPVADLRVRRGDTVRRGERFGALAPGGHGHGGQDRGLHWGARRGPIYLDPRTLLDEGIPRPSLVGPGRWEGHAHVVSPYEPWGGARWNGTRLASSPIARAPGFAVPPSPNHLIVLGGLGSSSARLPLDVDHLGYPDRSVTGLSYAGRDEPDHLDPDDPWRDQLPYGPEDTWAGVEVAAARLADQLRAQRAREPGRAVDLLGYSMGGVVILHYLTHLHDPYDPTLPTIGRVVTIAAPHQGSDLAGAARWVQGQPVVGGTVELVRGWIRDGDGRSHRDRVPIDAPTLRQLDPTSSFTAGHRDAWVQALDDGAAGPLAMGTEVLAIGAQADLVVGPGRSTLPLDLHGSWEARVPALAGRLDADEVVTETVLPGGHTGVLSTEAVREVTWRFLAGEEVTAASGGVVAWSTDELGQAINVGAAAAWAHGGVVGELRRLRRDPASAGPVEVTDGLDEVVDDLSGRSSDGAGPSARWTGSEGPG